ncbi:YfjI family protein [Geofilum rubicundum]|uniref:DUF3987 domain-containing protein n=1 Tax=Geofilum rubicundum JCM 15548 TaxID=1236989 RepID=A0A0E9LRV2_9BACT|nr:YfjI family protein [Geofilum rubicundum]GAO28327.1 hypothetical protein JCM15548_1407 [Geofilum rubicundum JCM 15548]
MKNNFSKTNPLHKFQSKGSQINPTFEDLNDPDALNNHLNVFLEAFEAEQKAKTNAFPIEVFPKTVQEIITATNESLKFPVDFIAVSMLYAVSVSIGNTHRIEVMKGWEEGAVLYISIVGRAGTNKSHPLRFALKPIQKQDDLKFQKFQKEMDEYNAIAALSKNERKEQGYDDMIKPVWEQYLVSDFTPEALADVHRINRRGLGVYADELASWFKNFDRYNKGSEEQFWLSAWSSISITINRKTTESTKIQSPFISVIGTIQPGVINELAANRTENGFLDRLLFVVPDDLKKSYWSEKDLDSNVIENWENIISSLLNMPMSQDGEGNPMPMLLRFTPEAKKRLSQWQRQLTDLSNKPENESVCGIFAKIEVYAIRLALCLEMMRYACNQSERQYVSLESVDGAIQLAEYFQRSALKVHAIVSNTNPLEKLPSDKQNLYNALPEAFLTNEGVEVAKNMGVAERTFKLFISNKDLFNHLKRGEYEKRF